MFFKRKIKTLEWGEPLFEVVDVQNRLEDCRSLGVEIETYYQIRNNRTGKLKWVNKRFVGDYGIKLGG